MPYGKMDILSNSKNNLQDDIEVLDEEIHNKSI